MVAQENRESRNAERLMLAYLCVKDLQGLVRQVPILDRFGLSDAEIAAVCDVSMQSVRNARLEARKKGTTGKRGV